MATPYGAGSGSGGVVGAPPPTSSPSPIPQQWYEQKQTASNQESSNLRSVTPAMNNTRGAVSNSVRSYPARGPSPVPTAAMGAAGGAPSSYYSRSGTPQRYYGAYNSPTNADQTNNTPQPPSSTGLIRLTLRKPMGIVFEPMYDPNSPSVQRGVRICDLPRTGSAALSRKLEVGDELLSINDKTMSRLTFDEIMDFIIEADPEQVNLLFRRPRKETLAARQAKSTNANNNGTSVKWVDDDHRKKKDKKKSKEASTKHEKKSHSKSRSRKDEEDTVQSAESDHHSPRKRSSRTRSKDPYESESFLDLLIDTICANTDNVCRDRSGADRRQGDDDYYSDEDDDRTSTSADDSTYVTYESEPPKRKEKRRKGQNRDSSPSIYDETEDDTLTSMEEDKRNRKGKREISARSSASNEGPEEDASLPKRSDKPYEDDATLETVETTERAKEVTTATASPPPLGLAPQQETVAPASEADVVDAPIAELEYDGRIDHGADVSVMESLGGPSLLIEKQRHAAVAAKGSEITSENTVSRDLISKFGKDYPTEFGFSREQTIQREPIKFYTFVVKKLLQEHEPEKVRLLDKLLAKYKGREEHLVRKLSVRYDRSNEGDTPTIPEGDEGGFSSFVMDVNRQKESGATAAAVQSAKARLGAFETDEWPTGKSTKDDEGDDTGVAKPLDGDGDGSHASESYTASDFSGDSIDGTSPAVIAQVSELLNYVYGKTSVPGQIDRVSTIMRAYEGREAVLLELLETKALIKANAEKESAANLPSFLRNSPALHQAADDDDDAGANPATSPVSGLTNPNSPTAEPGARTLIQDDISSMSGVSAPANGHHASGMKTGMDDSLTSSAKIPLDETKETGSREGAKRTDKNPVDSSPSKSTNQHPSTKANPADDSSKVPDREKKKKKKGIFGGLFGKKGRKSKEPSIAISGNDAARGGKKSLMSPKSKKGYSQSTEGSI